MQDAHSLPHSRVQRSSRQGFSLVEVVFSLGVVSFAMISILGLLPVGLTTFHKAKTSIVESQIAQALTNDILLTDFAHVSGMAGKQFVYDDAGAAVTTTSTMPVIYTATVEIQSLDNVNYYPVKLQSTAGATTTDEAYSVRIVIKNTSAPAERHAYSVLVAKNSL